MLQSVSLSDSLGAALHLTVAGHPGELMSETNEAAQPARAKDEFFSADMHMFHVTVGLALIFYFGAWAAWSRRPFLNPNRFEVLGLYWAFVDIFRWLSILSFACVIAVWFFKKVKPGKGPAGAH